MKQILVVDDDAEVARLLSKHLTEAGYRVKIALNARECVAALQVSKYDLILLDRWLPDADGLSLCVAIRAEEKLTPVIMLTSDKTEQAKIRGLETGADDYVVKPFSMPELLARMTAVFRRTSQTAHSASAGAAVEELKIGPFEIAFDKRTVRLNGRSLDLTATEFDLLGEFAKHPSKAHSRAELLSAVWGYSASSYSGTLTVHINRLRQKIEKDPARPEYLQTVWGVGYKFEVAGEGMNG